MVVTVAAGGARENYTRTEGSRECGDRVRVRHPVPSCFHLERSSLTSQHIPPATATREALGNPPGTTLWRLSCHSATPPLLGWSPTFPRESFPGSLFGPALPSSPWLSSLRELIQARTGVTSRQVTPLCPLESTLSSALALGFRSLLAVSTGGPVIVIVSN